jgi:hypothetical protein
MLSVVSRGYTIISLTMAIDNEEHSGIYYQRPADRLPAFERCYTAMRSALITQLGLHILSSNMDSASLDHKNQSHWIFIRQRISACD